ncbi:MULTISPECIES: hypothetical protein [unclassified Epibacterium]|uniref:hypothetical protein n=1 Tax=unclassified Epibacterium TaxID=2639179 RepID=UPI001EF62CBF|nr:MULTISPECIES: hypothetical protein [unclassified Epibacterium]MCG7622730.1 hypothetical protein [Epibacterium sp. Ofav1-8]MCG7626488.1 hypothetical protein [Epibacterium sp. MM17-32]
MNNKAPQYQANTWTVPAGGRLEVARQAEFLICLEATAPFKIAFDNGTETNFEQGLTFTVKNQFNRIRIYNPHAQDISVRLGFGRGDVTDARLVVSGSVEVETTAPSVIDTIDVFTVGAGASALVDGADLRRQELAVRNLSDTDDVWLRGDAMTTAGGLLLKASEGALLTASAAVYAYNPNGAGVDLSALSIRKEV